MKKRMLSLVTILVCFLCACSNPQVSPASTGSTGSASSAPPAALEEEVWPVNEYTQNLPVPPGAVAWATLDTERQYCGVSLTGMGQSDFDSYLDLLKQEGFSPLEELSEEVKGQDYVSIGALLSDGETCLSLSYIPDQLTLYITFADGAGDIRP